MRLFIFSFLLLFHVNVFSQQLIVRFDEDCRKENSELFLDVMEKVLGEKKIKKFLRREKKIDFLDSETEVGELSVLLKLFVVFNTEGKIIDANFVLFGDKLNKRGKRKIIEYILSQQTSFNVCWKNVYDIEIFLKKGGTIEEIEKEFYENLYREDLWNGEYGMRIDFPGYITQEFYDKYLKELEQK